MKKKLTARESAAHICSVSRQTKKTLRTKLLTKGYSSDEADSAVLAMMELEYINEAQYARAFVSDSYKIKKHGKIRIGRALMEKGVPQRIIEEAIGNSGVDEKEIIASELEKRFKTEDNKDKIYRYFLSRGFSSGDIGECIND
ncbi:MAG: regulatory protein RecX [Bacillota bacterium]|nr:regulatory protein RecX [Bacillota bacterium]